MKLLGYGVLTVAIGAACFFVGVGTERWKSAKAPDVREALPLTAKGPALDNAEQVIAVPVQDGSRVLGLHLLGIRPGGQAGMIGLRNNDVLETINGEPAVEAEQITTAFARLEDSGKIELQVQRKRARVDINYRK